MEKAETAGTAAVPDGSRIGWTAPSNGWTAPSQGWKAPTVGWTPPPTKGWGKPANNYYKPSNQYNNNYNNHNQYQHNGHNQNYQYNQQWNNAPTYSWQDKRAGGRPRRPSSIIFALPDTNERRPAQNFGGRTPSPVVRGRSVQEE